MEMTLIKLLTYTFIGVAAVLFIYVTALAAFLYNSIQRIKADNNENRK